MMTKVANKQKKQVQ